MKTSVALLAAAAGLAMAKPEFLNSNFDVVPGEPFTLKFKGCDSGCKIVLLNGPSTNLKEVQTLIPKTTGTEETITLSKNFNTDKYAFKIEDSAGEVNYSEQFDFEGKTPESTTPAQTSTVASTSVESSTSAQSTPSLVTVTTQSSATTPAASTTGSQTGTATTSGASQTTSGSSDSDRNTGGADRLGSSHVTLAAAVVAVAGYFL